MNNKVILSPPEAKDVKLSSGQSLEDNINNLNNAIAQLQRNFLDKTYPVGSIYLSLNSTSPASLFGGTWKQIKDRFLLAAGDTYAA